MLDTAPVTDPKGPGDEASNQDERVNHVLVTGTSRPWDGTALRAARMVGRTLARRGFGLVTGNAPGVDKAAADAFCAKVARMSGDDAVIGSYTQLALSYLRRGSFWPIPGYAARPESRVALRSTHEWLEEATARCVAAVMVGGHAGRIRSALAGGGAMRIVNRFLEEGKPVFPIPFTGGDSDEVFQAVLVRWRESPVPGLSRDQFVRLALPWTTDTGDLADLLLGTLADTPDVFISYRHQDTGWASARLHRELSERFGTRRVFMDLDDIRVGDPWNETIERALACCRVGVVLVGNHWLDPDPATGRRRLHDEKDYVRKEIRRMLESGKPVIVVLADAALPGADDLPADLLSLSGRQAIPVTNATWEIDVEQIVDKIRRVLSDCSTPGPTP